MSDRPGDPPGDPSRPPCAGLWNTPMVHVDGSVTTCCLDEHLENRIGSLRDSPLPALWHGRTMHRWRLAHIRGRFEDSGPLCTRCNWRSAGSYPPEDVEAYLEKTGEHGLLEALRRRR